MLIKSAASVAKMTLEPIEPTMLEPTVKRPTPITDPAVIVTASRMPKQRLRAGLFVSCICVDTPWRPG